MAKPHTTPAGRALAIAAVALGLAAAGTRPPTNGRDPGPAVPAVPTAPPAPSLAADYARDGLTRRLRVEPPLPAARPRVAPASSAPSTRFP